MSYALPSPLYHRAFGLLSQRISEGTYGPGDQLPTEDELAAEFGVSRATVRQAVGELVKRGMVIRQQGRGTFVCASVAERPKPFVSSLAELILETKRSGIKSASMRHKEAITPLVASKLEISDNRATVLERTRLLGDQVFAYVVQYLPSSIGELVTAREVDRLGMLTALHRKGVALGEAQQTVRAQLADVATAEALGIEIASAVLHAERVLRGKDGKPIELVWAWYRGDMYEYQATLEMMESDGRIEATIT